MSGTKCIAATQLHTNLQHPSSYHKFREHAKANHVRTSQRHCRIRKQDRPKETPVSRCMQSSRTLEKSKSFDGITDFNQQDNGKSDQHSAL